MMWSQSSVTNINVPIWVTDPGIGQVDEVKPIADTAVDRVRSVSGVEGRFDSIKGSAARPSLQRGIITRSR